MLELFNAELPEANYVSTSVEDLVFFNNRLGLLFSSITKDSTTSSTGTRIDVLRTGCRVYSVSLLEGCRSDWSLLDDDSYLGASFLEDCTLEQCYDIAKTVQAQDTHDIRFEIVSYEVSLKVR